MRRNKSKLNRPVTVDMEEVGPVIFKTSSRARYLNIRIKPYGDVHVSVPLNMSMATAQRTVLQKKTWILKNLRKIKESEKKSILYDGSRDLTTRQHRIEVKPTSATGFRVELRNGLVRVHYPQRLKLTHSKVQAAVWQGLLAAYRKEAKAYLPARLEYFAKRHGFKYNKVFIKNHKSRWGSCSAKNNVNLSLHLMRLPDEVIDYVILHELVHTEIKNHSKKFWLRLEKVCPDVKRLRKRIREFER